MHIRLLLKRDSTNQYSNELLTNQTKDERRSKRMLDSRKDMTTQDKIQTKKVQFKNDSTNVNNELLHINKKDTTEESSLYQPLPATE